MSEPFSENNKKHIISLLFAEFVQRVVIVKNSNLFACLPFSHSWFIHFLSSCNINEEKIFCSSSTDVFYISDSSRHPHTSQPLKQ